MPRSPSIIATAPDDREIYLVLDDFGGRLGHTWPEVGEERTNRETVIADLLAGQYASPVLVVAFNMAEGWSRDVSKEIASELMQRCVNEGRDLPASLEGFVFGHRRTPSSH